MAAVTELWRGQTGPDLTFPNDPVVLRIATHNVWGQNFDPEHTIDVLQSLDAEMIGLQEAFGNSRGIESALLKPTLSAPDATVTRLGWSPVWKSSIPAVWNGATRIGPTAVLRSGAGKFRERCGPASASTMAATSSLSQHT
ncbi:hypothetical protein HXX25_06840 [Hyphobacterium sp. CCMP332]|uniref:hypothetical protein n=1 Tax=Hyphobacterium sp. CCMP332 TaxID=2749086 RepID=UPI00164F7796|nr:hypothetical protein [Hyphobacterium sp. CCMP332]QNL19051.1 hypothetical protein HXX25_06840 [Hyphobacterium sp. CCMP332]